MAKSLLDVIERTPLLSGRFSNSSTLEDVLKYIDQVLLSDSDPDEDWEAILDNVDNLAEQHGESVTLDTLVK
ncbi:hypothetical protein [Anatilimnocola floriformis]|uniref:hypothetical protein n=1 Tax=Anatilimnocola floriformis TaxID=2948575 RepID=UPI0020C25215|nr:hypothetical protein [Anatilimnocola floriformis]